MPAIPAACPACCGRRSSRGPPRLALDSTRDRTAMRRVALRVLARRSPTDAPRSGSKRHMPVTHRSWPRPSVLAWGRRHARPATWLGHPGDRARRPVHRNRGHRPSAAHGARGHLVVAETAGRQYAPRRDPPVRHGVGVRLLGRLSHRATAHTTSRPRACPRRFTTGRSRRASRISSSRARARSASTTTTSGSRR